MLKDMLTAWIIIFLVCWDFISVRFTDPTELHNITMGISVLSYKAESPLWQYLLAGIVLIWIGFFIAPELISIMIMCFSKLIPKNASDESQNSINHHLIYFLFLLANFWVYLLNRHYSKIYLENNRFLLNIIDNSNSNIMIITEKGKILFINQKWEDWILKYWSGHPPDEFTSLIAEYDRKRFLETVSKSWKTNESQKMHAHLSLRTYVDNIRNPLKKESELGKELDDELYDLEFSKSRWEGNKWAILCFSQVRVKDENDSSEHIQSQSILHQINDLVLETCYKYERFKDIDSKFRIL